MITPCDANERTESDFSDYPAEYERVITHHVREFGVEARREGKAWELAFNGPIQPIDSSGTAYGVVVRLARIKNPVTRELFSTNLLFFMPTPQMCGMHNVYDLVHEFPFARITAARDERPRPDDYAPNPEGVIMEDIRIAPVGDLWWVTGQGYRGKILIGDRFVHDVGVYGALVDPKSPAPRIVLQPLFGGGSVGSYKNSVLLPSPGGERWIGARSMFHTKNLHYFGEESGGWALRGEIEGLPDCMPGNVWEDVHRVGLGSNFLPCPELGGHIGLVHVVTDKNNPAKPRTADAAHPGIEEQYEGWVVLLRVEDGRPVIRAAARALTPDSRPSCYLGKGELFDNKRVAFPISLYACADDLHVGYGWGDRALFQAIYKRQEVIDRLRQ